VFPHFKYRPVYTAVTAEESLFMLRDFSHGEIVLYGMQVEFELSF
jgi:hypothetical protein